MLIIDGGSSKWKIEIMRRQKKELRSLFYL